MRGPTLVKTCIILFGGRCSVQNKLQFCVPPKPNSCALDCVHIHSSLARYINRLNSHAPRDLPEKTSGGNCETRCTAQFRTLELGKSMERDSEIVLMH